MSHRRLVATAAFVAAGIALIPNVAQADDSPQAPARQAAPASSPAALTKAAATLRPHTFTDSAKHSVRVQNTATVSTKNARVAAGRISGGTIYALSTSCPSDTGTGTQADPYCSIQAAVDAAQPGDTISVSSSGSANDFSTESVTITTSDLSIVGADTTARISSADDKPALVLDGATNVTVSNIMLTSTGAPAVQIIGSSGITFDSAYVDGDGGLTHPAMTIDGASSKISVTRTYLDAGGGAAADGAVSVASGAQDITFAGNIIAAAGINATGVQGLTVTNNTIQRGCSPAVSVAGASTGVSIENNLFEDANPTTDAVLGGFKSWCTEKGHDWAADVTVAAESVSGVTTDYNAFYVFGSDATAPYEWAGISYPTLAAFRTASHQGANDLNDTVAATSATLRPGKAATADFKPSPNSAVIGSADPDAPGKPGTDFYGTGSFTSRGAVEFDDPNPTLAVAIAGGWDDTAYQGGLTTHVTSGNVAWRLTVSWGDGAVTTTDGSGIEDVDGDHKYAKVGTYPLVLTVTDANNKTVSYRTTWLTLGSSYQAYGPTRLLDTRYGIGAPKVKIPARGTVRLQVGGRGTIPAQIDAAALNLTVTNPAASGFIIAYPDGAARPNTSNVNFTAKRTVPNLSLVPVGGNGYVDLYNSSTGPVDLIADIDGYYGWTSASYYQPLSPYRLADTRYGTGTPKHQLTPGGSIALQVAGADKGQLPASGITAVALNVTATNTKSSGVVTAYPDGTAVPVASNLNFTSGQTIANSVVTPVGKDGKIRVALNAGAKPMDVVVDVVGYYSASAKGAFVPTPPHREIDTRDPSDTVYGPLYPEGYIWDAFAAGEPDFTAVVLNTTVANTTGAGWLGVAPDPNSLAQYKNGTDNWPPTPVSSTLNWTKGQIVPNLVQASLGKNGIVDFINRSGGKMDLIVDTFGYYQTD